MHFLELKAKVKPGKENELNQVIKDLIPLFNSIPDINTQVHFNDEEGELIVKFSNYGSSQMINELYDNENFNLLLGSLKVLCSGHTVIYPSNNDEINNLITNNLREP